MRTALHRHRRLKRPGVAGVADQRRSGKLLNVGDGHRRERGTLYEVPVGLRKPQRHRIEAVGPGLVVFYATGVTKADVDGRVRAEEVRVVERDPPMWASHTVPG